MHPLISVNDLMNQLGQEPRPTVLDVRWSLLGPPGRIAYEQGHLPHAVFVDLDTELAGVRGSDTGRHPLPEAHDLEVTLRRAGVSADRPVVIYDADDGAAAARAWWLLRWAGHPSVAVLDGGYAAWVEAGLPTTVEEPHPGAGDFQVRPGHMPTLDADAAARVAAEGALLDARAPERYRGETDPVDPRAGHVPGARNAPFVDNTDMSGYWRGPAELARRFADLGVDSTSTIGVYCGSGVTACSVVLALEHAGIAASDHAAALYPGSWSEWSADPQRPVATGDPEAECDD